MNRALWLLIFLVAITSGFAQNKITVLFVGNSLTYSNNLPELVKQIAACDSVTLEYTMLANPNYALIDHWHEGIVITEIQSKKYDFVVVQQGPSSQPEGRTMLINDGLTFAKLCAANHSQLAFFTVWPSKVRSFDFPGVLESYRMAADSSKSILCPAGNAWLGLLNNYPEFKLYSDDNFHPAYKGSFLAALVIYGRLMKKANFNFLEYEKIKNPALSKPDFKILIKAAQRTL